MNVFMHVLRFLAMFTIAFVSKEGIGYKIAAMVAMIAMCAAVIWDTLNN